MNRIAVLLESGPQGISYASFAAIKAAQSCQAPITLCLVGHELNPLLDQLKNLSGVTTILYCDDISYQHPILPEHFCQWAKEHLSGFSHVFIGSSSWGKAALPRLAAALNAPQCSDVIDIIDPHTIVRQMYAGNINATIKHSDRPYCYSIRASAYLGACQQQDNNNVCLTPCAPQPAWTKSTHIETTHSHQSGPTLANAKIVIGGGRGLGTTEAFSQLKELASRWGAAVGASRAAVDAGLMPNEYQIGQTGQIIAPELYIAIGISGAIQHIAGILDSRVIVAINSDADAPIFNVANYKLVMDWQTALPKIEQVLQQRGLLTASCLT